MSPYFNEDNTAGYSSDELEMLNDVLDALREEYLEVEDSTLGDAIHNAFGEDSDYESLLQDVFNRFTGTPDPTGC